MKPNTGQIAGIPKNPRFIRDERFAKLIRSIIDHPEMLELRECLVVEYADEYVAITGNMRWRSVDEVSSMSDDDLSVMMEEKQTDDNFNEWLAAISEGPQIHSIYDHSSYRNYRGNQGLHQNKIY